MKAEEMWQASTGKGVTVAVIDNKVDDSIPELRGQVLKGKDFTKTQDSSVRSNSHGTQMAALIAGSGRSGGIQGVAPGAKILPLKDGGFDHTEIDDPTDKWVKAIRYAIKKDARIINMSVGAVGLLDGSAEKMQAAVDEANAKGVLILAGMGNDGDIGGEAAYPARLRGVVAVSAVDKTGTVTKFSTNGAQVALAAPGAEIPERCSTDGGWCQGKGTSQATAIASGSAALIWSAHPHWTANQVLRVMMQTASKPEGKVPSRYIGYGIIRPGQVLLDGKGDPGPADVNPLFPDYHPGQNSSTSPSSPSQTDAPSEASDTQDKAAGTSTSGDDDGEGSTLLYVGVGIAAVLALGGGVFALARQRRGT
ncbi:S8 family serine peptidase [Streptomyces luomodiensis]|uniref:S8 family serine peptidase n=1 Tax=Streptomyces luomodiensis TaxID=3026192 RepID=A0ABY9V2W3_9ACTN|nr:S8 family serine peptidase [Streptomyces sp. SCA4-21]WNE99229.1 S8 family serine peptidase [Streptomyces sp. SCA4-21]